MEHGSASEGGAAPPSRRARRAPRAASSDSRIAQLALDLHDGPLQDMAAVACFVGLLRDQLRVVAANDATRERLLTLIDAVDRGLAVLDDDLRDLAWSMRSPAGADAALDEALRSALEQLAQKTGAETRLDVRGPVETLPAAVRTTILRVAQEALLNAAQHSGAQDVRVSLAVADGRVRLEVADDGCGFDVESGLAAAAREGRLGVVGMAERVRLLGGEFELQSRCGGPTSVAAILVATGDARRWSRH